MSKMSEVTPLGKVERPEKGFIPHKVTCVWTLQKWEFHWRIYRWEVSSHEIFICFKCIQIHTALENSFKSMCERVSSVFHMRKNQLVKYVPLEFMLKQIRESWGLNCHTESRVWPRVQLHPWVQLVLKVKKNRVKFNPMDLRDQREPFSWPLGSKVGQSTAIQLFIRDVGSGTTVQT